MTSVVDDDHLKLLETAGTHSARISSFESPLADVCTLSGISRAGIPIFSLLFS